MGSQQMTLQSIGNSRSQLVLKQVSTSWTLAIDGRDNAVIKIKFSRRLFNLSKLTSVYSEQKQRTITLRPEQQYKALQSARQQAMTSDYQADYARRAGIEGTLSERSVLMDYTCSIHWVSQNPSTTSNHSNSNQVLRIFHWLSGVPQPRGPRSLQGSSVSYAIFRHQYQKWIRADNGAILRIVDI